MKTMLMSYLMKFSFLSIYYLFVPSWSTLYNTASFINVLMDTFPILLLEIFGVFTLFCKKEIRVRYMIFLKRIYNLLALLYVLTDFITELSPILSAWFILGVISFIFGIVTPCGKENSEGLYTK